jgi:bifunctional DNA-binding transcriptional regulator/antitoxin component of YhaV-PrlF toxin-antitoxin module
MILQKQKAREYKGKPIYKWVIVIPPKDIEELGWNEGIDVEGIVIKDKGYFISKTKS